MSRRGASGLAYGLIVGLIAVVAIGAISVTGSEVRELFGLVGTDLEAVAEARQGGGDEPGGQQDGAGGAAVDDSGITEPGFAGSGSPLTLDVTGNDGGSSPGVTGIGSAPANGTAVTGPGAGEVTYTPDQGFSGVDSFTYEMDPGDGSTEMGTVTVTVLDPFNVTAAADVSDPTDKQISLREAVGHARDSGAAQTVTLDAAALGGADVVLDSEITIDFATPLIVEASQFGVTLDGQRTNRHFHVTASGADVTFRDLTFTRGFADADGGSIFAFGGGGGSSFTVERCVFIGNGTDTGSDETELGGAISVRNSGAVIIRKTTFQGNTGQQGGALAMILNAGPVLVENSTFFGNQAVIGDSAIPNFKGRGGAVTHGSNSGSQKFVNSTFFGNVGEDSRDVAGSAIHISNLFDTGTNFEFLNSITIGNTGTPNNIGIFRTNFVAAHSIIESRELLNATENVSDDNQLPGSATVSNTFGSASPSLSGTGGPQVLAIAPGGPAHDNGDAGLAGVPTDDQRGLPRDGSPDLGAFEIQ